MKSINVVIIVLIILFILFNINTSYNKGVLNSIQYRNNNNTNKLIVTPEDISIENRGDINRKMTHLPYPQTTSIHRSLSTNYPEDLSIISQGSIINNPDTIVQIRRDKVASNETHFPKYYLKDNLSGNTMGTTEYNLAETDNLSSNKAWSDENVSQYPNFYTSKLDNEITNIGAFFDVNNNLVDSTNPRSTALVGDICYKTKEGENICLDNSRLYNPPPALISDKNNCGFLNSIGLLEYSNLINEEQERVNNGGYLYNNVKGSKINNEVYSKPIEQPVQSCHI